MPGQQKPRSAVTRVKPEDARLREVEKLWSAGDLTSASAALTKILEDFPTLLAVHERAYDLFRTWQQPADARQTLALMEQRFPSEPSVYVRLSEVAIEEKDLSAAEKALRQAVDLTTDEATKAPLAARLETIVTERAEAARRQAEADDQAAALSIIERRVVGGQIPEAAREIEVLLTKYPADGGLRFKAHDLLAHMGRFNDAEKRLLESIEMAPDPDTARVRRLQIKELAYRKEVAIEAARRQAITVRLKKMSLLVEDGNVTQALADLNELLREYPKDPFVHAGVHSVYAQAGDFVAAEFHLKTALDAAVEGQSRNQLELQFVELTHRREKKAADLEHAAHGYTRQGKFAEAVTALRDLDKVTMYHRAAYIARAGLLGVYRKYAEAVKVYNRILQDSTLDTGRKQIEALRDYCIRQVTAQVAPPKDVQYCVFCGARQTKGAAYCHVCLMFQHPIARITARKENTTFLFAEGRLRGVEYRWEDTHGARNALTGIMGGLAAGAGKTAVDMKFKSSEVVYRKFEFDYDGETPESVTFRSSATGGEVETYRIDGATSVSYRVAEQGGRDESAALKDLFIYPTHPVIDPVFAAQAFGQNIHRAFSPNLSFTPFQWLQPSLFALIYDEHGRVSRAVDVYEFGQRTSAGHLEVTGRRTFTGDNARDPMQEPNYVEVGYNAQGLVTMFRRMSGAKEVWRREVTYGVHGIVGERVLTQGRVSEQTTYQWGGTTLQTADVKIGDYKATAYFAFPLPTQFSLTVDEATAASAPDYLVVAERLLNLKRSEQAFVYFNKAVERFPTDPQAYLQRGNAFLRMKATEQAKQDFLKFLTLAPKSPHVKGVKQQLKTIDPFGKY